MDAHRSGFTFGTSLIRCHSNLKKQQLKNGIIIKRLKSNRLIAKVFLLISFLHGNQILIRTCKIAKLAMNNLLTSRNTVLIELIERTRHLQAY